MNAYNHAQNVMVTTLSCLVCYDVDRLINKLSFQGSKVTSKQFGQMKLPNTIGT